MPLFHVTIATRGRATMFADERSLLAGVRAVTRSPRVVLFSLVDDHVHLVVDGDGSIAARAASRTLGAAGAADRLPADVRPVQGRGHLTSLVGYFARQPRKHGLADHPSLWAGSCAPDLLGVRRLPGFASDRIAYQLPRASVRDLVLAGAEVWRPALNAATDDELVEHGAVALWQTAHAAFGLTPADDVRERVRARIAWAHLAGDPGREALLVPDRTFRWLRAQPAEVDAIERLRRRVTLERWTRAVGGNPRPLSALNPARLPHGGRNPAIDAR